jgi:hypothetical protein
MRTAWLADILGRIAEHQAQKLDELLPWNPGRSVQTPPGVVGQTPPPVKQDTDGFLV